MCYPSCYPRLNLRRLECSISPMVPSFIQRACYDCVALTMCSSVHVGFTFIVIFACKEWWVQSKPFQRFSISPFPISRYHFSFPISSFPIPSFTSIYPSDPPGFRKHFLHNITWQNRINCKLQRHRDEHRSLDANGTQGKRAGASSLVPLANQQHKVNLQWVYIARSWSCAWCVYLRFSSTVSAQGPGSNADWTGPDGPGCDASEGHMRGSP